MLKRIIGTLSNAALLLGSSAGYAATVTVADSHSLQRYGNNSPFLFDSLEILASDGGGVRPHFRGYVEFDLSSIIAGNHTYMLHLPDTGGMTPDFGGEFSTTDIYTYSGDGIVSIGDWSAGTDLLESITRPYLGEDTTIDITSAINTALASGDSYFGLAFRSSFGWDGFGFAGNLPGPDVLHISYEVSAVPVPAAAWLFGSGLIGLAGMARRKKV